ncbi:hypothetical protein EV13_2135 [Prochlorococcus sp. MIT 0702]|nr:hypothetical protein EV13_2135 [Prochlorococcus sp. MIT 0702]KGG27675.1 hypothetical protein EV12_1105 [Prochlorococcus sp. MIT 0701]KGG31914.1 hypothetical protein EV14_2122 [Prochlorococcus sp. MIT 0703]
MARGEKLMVSFSVAHDYSQSLLLSITRLCKHLIGKKVPCICGLQIGHTANPNTLGCFGCWYQSTSTAAKGN